MRIMLFDAIAGGHHPLYARRVAEALAEDHDVVVAGAEDVVAQCADVASETVLVSAPPAHVRKRRNRALAEVRVLNSIARSTESDHVVHLFADAPMRALIRLPPPVPTTVLVFRPRAHYPKLYGSPLAPRDALAARAHEAVVTRWRLCAQAHSVWTLDAAAAARWARWAGAPVSWFPEPAVDTSQIDTTAVHPRVGAILYGRLAPRKGVEQLVRAAASSHGAIGLTIAGSVDPSRRPWAEEQLVALREAGVQVDARLYDHDELAGLRALAGARCALLPYVEHFGMSRVLLEAAAVGTPVVATNRGLIGHLVVQFNLGIAVDPDDSSALWHAVTQLTQDSNAAARYAKGLAEFARLHSQRRFASSIIQTFGLPPTSRAARQSEG